MQKSSSDVSSATKPAPAPLAAGKFILLAIGAEPNDVNIFTPSGWNKVGGDKDKPASLLSSDGACEMRDLAVSNTLNKSYQFYIVQAK